MHDRTLRNISLLLSLAGIVLLFLISGSIEPTALAIGSITTKDVGKAAKVCGNVTSLKVTKDSHLFMSLQDSTGEVRFVVFNSSMRKLNQPINATSFRKGVRVCVSGVIQEYPKASGSLELVYSGGPPPKVE
ncbi:MAG: OB-fold nucleic acid binding domain-containing protein [Candidatus Aenigmarchaeota archaeon]|nr:OB-fold nucleic acid binding domain-containing protein [Candidatus Aenigmarchaeota archaeon]